MSVTLNLNQARELLEFFGGEDASVTVSKLHNHAHSGPGVYAWLTEHPEEGSIKLDETPTPAGVSELGHQVIRTAGTDEVTPGGEG